MGPLDQLFGNRSGGSRIPIVNLALLGLLGYRTLKGKGKLAELFNINRQPDAAGVPGGQAPAGQAPSERMGLEDIVRGGLGGLLGAGGLGGLLNGGLRDLVDRFQQKGMGNVADSWVSRGENRRISAAELEQALGAETVDDLAANAGIPREQLLADLSSRLPEVVDQLTPEGRVPTEAEAGEWVAQSMRPDAGQTRNP
jgi:uncharacterized protein YidB (DUF937 family)